ncbi:MAG: acetyl-CoA carboxylase biotin carboxyl carrier protein [Bacteroidetes bacterium]|nr:acetyl-CoA carboxylase biotin carboxyl carrier protein [Bacteroidota bacterium]
MDLNYIRKLVKLVDESGVDEIEIEEEGTKLRISKHNQNSSAVPTLIPQIITQPQPVAQVVTDPEIGAANPASRSEAQPPKTEEKKYHQVRSPIVGTFYTAPAPNADPYVQVGSTVQQGTVLCIIEAMKLMNEIESDVAGKVVSALVENGRPVEYNQPLFEIEPA